MTQDYFEAGLNWHNATWTDSENNAWFGMPLWYLVGWMEGPVGANRMEFNDTLANEGYTVNVINGQGFIQSFNSTFVAHNDNIIVAAELNGASLPAPYWPLRLCGSALTGSEMLVNIVEIQMTNVPGS
jgi:hypothetical protein